MSASQTSSSTPTTSYKPRRKRKQPLGAHDGKTRDVNQRFAPMPKTPEETGFPVDTDGNVIFDKPRLMYASFSYFMSELKDDRGTNLTVADHHEDWCELMEAERRLCILAPRDHGKALALDTPIPTPSGWVMMGDIRDGDVVFDENGQPTRVTKSHDVLLGRTCYRVVFDDGSSIVADADHLWETSTLAERSSGGTTRKVRTTEQIAGSVRVNGANNHAIPVARALATPDIEAPVDPYVLGAWLGDGTGREAAVTIGDSEQLYELMRRGAVLRLRPSSTAVRSTSATYHVKGLMQPLQSMGLINDPRRGIYGQKHIPSRYLRASVEQRQELLAGLMDADGHASKTDATVEFVNTNEALARDVFELVVSLGFKPTFLIGDAKLNGRVIGKKFRIRWSPRVPVFSIPRKASVLRSDRARANRTSHRYIVSVERVDSVPVRCITVDSPSRLYLAGPSMVPTHNTWTALCYLMWKCWKHNRDATGALKSGQPDGEFQAILFSDTYNQAAEFFSKMQMLVLANEELFGDILPTGSKGAKASIKEAWTGGHIRFRNRADVSIRSFGTGTRGLHPDLIVCDDILSDSNASTQYQRAKVWKYFVGTIDPMLGPKGQLIVIGTAQHHSDLLHKLRKVGGWKWVKYRSVNWDTGRVLWPDRHDITDLKQKQTMDPILFSREYQNDPRDDASSYFPLTLTSPVLDQGKHLTMVDQYMKQPGEIIVLSADFAMSESIGADYCVVMVAKLNIANQKRELIWAVRDKGWSFQTQVNALRFACRMFDVDLGIVENNSFQRWVRQETERWPETAGKILGHQTGIEKISMKDGIPMLTLPLSQRLWTFPSADDRSRDFAHIWQSEMNAMGWVNDKLQGVGEHDDTVMAFWLLERAVRMVNTLLQQGPQEQYVTMKEVGLERVQIGDW